MTGADANADTIVAVASAPGRGGVGIVRLSGPRSREIAETVCGRGLRPRHAHHARFVDHDGRVIDDGIALWFRAPRSFTGEDVVELQAHGSPVVLAELVARCAALGARHARAGEFSERAFVNGRIDLAQAEAVADLIAAQSTAQARAARRSLDGEFSRRVDALLDALIRLRVYVEAAIDFPEEEIDFLAEGNVEADVAQLIAATDALLATARQGQRLRDGLHAVILGPPNVGKSSLLNALAGSDRAIVTDIAGTTRDLLREAVNVDGVEITLVDTAGLRDTGDTIEAEGMRRARAERDRADLALIVVDARDAAALPALLRECEAVPLRVVVHNKLDLAPDTSPRATAGEPHATDSGASNANDHHLWLSARTGDGLPALRDILKQAAGGDAGDGTLSARARHVTALERVAAHLAQGQHELQSRRAGELLADELHQAQQALSEITGAYTSDDLLGAIFSSFCIGK